MRNKNIVLIGMPSAGKSTIGQCLAGKLDLSFIDTDSVICEKANKPLRDIVNEDGLDTFLKIQEEAVIQLELENYVIATGGSVVYSEASMSHLKQDGIVIYLEVDYDEIQSRMAPGRRFARPEGKSFEELYSERVPLYEKYGDIKVNCTGKQVEEIADEIIKYYRSIYIEREEM